MGSATSIGKPGHKPANVVPDRKKKVRNLNTEM